MRTQIPSKMRVAPLLNPAFQPEGVRPGHILLINPFYPKDPHASFGKHVLTPTLALTSIAAATPSEWTIQYWDKNLLQGPPPGDPFPEVVGITVHLTFARRACELARWYRSRGSVVILGGLHATTCPDEVMSHADSVVIGEGVGVWPRVLGDLRSGRLQKTYRGTFTAPYRQEPAPRRTLLPRRSFLTTTSLIATRGCHNRCGFCYLATEGLHMPYQMRDPAQVAAEIVEDGQPYSVFVDNNLGSRPEYLLKLCETLAPLQIIWSAAVSIDVTDRPQLVREMALSGCTGVFVGFESLSQANIRAAGKKGPSPRDYAHRVRLLHDHGIQVNGSFVLGFDHDGPDVFERTVDWVEENRLECATFHILTPYPGTPLFRQMEEQGRLLHTNWDFYDTAHVVFRPQRMSPEQLAEGYEWCYTRLFSHRSIWRRRPSDWKAVAPYLLMSYLYKRSNRLTATVWGPLVEVTRRRHLGFRAHLERRSIAEPRAATVVSAGV